MNIRLLRSFALLLSALAVPAAWAHSGGHDGGFSSGAAHPLLGPDHLLAMVCVGVVSVQLGAAAIWRVPAAFVAAMALGGALGMLWPGAAFAELAIALSLVLLGLAIVAQRRMPVAPVMACVAAFGFCHGYAHGVEIPKAASPLAYTLGFLLSTVALHLCGLGLGLWARGGRVPSRLLQFGGLVVGVTGLAYLRGMA